jgi:CheY-like chemotaxis protein
MTMSLMKRVLVVDDDPVIGESFDRVLTPRGYAVIHAANGEQALERLAAEDYDLVYTDIKMPGLSGIEVARRVRASRPWLPVVVVTGYGSAENQARAKEIGVAAFLDKPLTPEMIERATAEFTTEAAAPTQVLEMPQAPAPAEKPLVATPPQPRRGALAFAKNVGLFLAAPLIGLVYVVIAPVVGLGLLAWMGGKALLARGQSRPE